jgi:hypothetical protein
MQCARQPEKLSAARRCLMLPHSSGVEVSIDDALQKCCYAFYRFDDSGLDDGARCWLTKIEAFMDAVKRRSLTADEQNELSRVVDELANWVTQRFWTF